MQLDIEQYQHVNTAKCSAVIAYNGKEEVIVPQGIRDIVCDREFQAQCEAPTEVKRKKGVFTILSVIV